MASEILELTVERPAAGGRMLARHDGIVVLVAGAVPGERVRARVERRSRSLIWATVTEVVEPSPARRATDVDPACGGADYLHIDYATQLGIKSQVVVEAFRRIGKMTIAPVAVEPSPEEGYRVRARLHAVNGRAGFFLEGTHTLCDAAATRQLSRGAVDAVQGLLAQPGVSRGVTSVVLSENTSATERVVHLEPAADVTEVDITGLELSGVTVPEGRAGVRVLAGSATVTDRAADLFSGQPPIPPDTTWTRHPVSFFQGNRYLTGALVTHVLEHATGKRVLDLYAGVGLFAVACAARGQSVTAVEGDRASGRDLDLNAAPYQPRLRVKRASVEEALPKLGDGHADSVIVDPPRTGLSAEALDGVSALRAPAVVYVSCDPATLARDAQKLAAAGYALAAVQAFDLFPNTAHVETVVTFTRAKR
jgi:tRNA/tmRNA/rRNA uracil-C5-methylase (TrmA/RlmC/RlmD family)